MLGRPIIDYAVYLLVRLFIAGVQALPPRACERIAQLLATVFTHILPVRKEVLRENLAIAFPELDEKGKQRLAWGMWRHLFLMVMEIAQTPRKIHRTNWRQRVDIPQVETIIRHMATERPAVVISGHFGNFELGGYLIALFGFPTHTVARKLDNVYLDRFINDFRGRTGQHMLPKQGSGDQIEQVLLDGGTLTLLGDQAAGDNGCWVPFFGKPASTHKAVALFSLSFAAPTLVMGVRRRGERMLDYEIALAGIVDPAEADFPYAGAQSMTEWYTACLETLIRQGPEQYWWVHRRWKGQPSKKALRRLQRSRQKIA